MEAIEYSDRIPGVAKVQGGVKILFDIDRVLNADEAAKLGQGF